MKNVARALTEIYEAQARLHELIVAAINDEVAALRRRAEATLRLASAKRDEAAEIEKDHDKARLEHEAGLSQRESEIMEKEIATLVAERDRAAAQGATARQRIGLHQA